MPLSGTAALLSESKTFSADDDAAASVTASPCRLECADWRIACVASRWPLAGAVWLVAFAFVSVSSCVLALESDKTYACNASASVLCLALCSASASASALALAAALVSASFPAFFAFSAAAFSAAASFSLCLKLEFMPFSSSFLSRDNV